jgi:trk system potassium uptake protein TrkA
MYVIVVGGGKVGYNMTKLLLSKGHEAILIEKNKAVYTRMQDELGEAVMYGDGADVITLREAGANRADVVVAVTGDDADNLVICQIAKIMFINPRTIARVNDPRNEDIFTSLGIDATVSSTRTINTLIEQKVDVNMIPLLALRGGDYEIVQIEISQTSATVDNQITQIGLPDDCVLMSISRANDTIIPHGNTVLKAGDTIIALTSKKSEEKLRSMFT